MVRIKKTKSIFTFIVLFFTILLITRISAMGVTPASVNIIYDAENGVDVEFDVRFISNSGDAGFANISIINDLYPYSGLEDDKPYFNSSQLEEYVTLSKDWLDLSKENIVTVKVKMPPNLQIAGPHSFGIKASEIPKGKGMIVITTGVLARVRIDSPYPGQFLILNNFGLTNVNEGESSVMIWQVKGKGEQRTDFNSKIELYSDKDVLLYTKDLGKNSVSLDQVYPPDGFNTELMPTSSFSAGTYKGVLTINFNDVVLKTPVVFNVGTESVALDNYGPKPLIKGEINKVSLTVRNLWNGNFDNVYAIISINGTTATTASSSLAPFGSIGLEQFIDVSSLPVGSYAGTIEIRFGKNTQIFPVVFEVAQKIVPPVPEEKKELPLTAIIIGIVILVILVGIILFFRRRNSGKKESLKESVIAQQENSEDKKVAEVQKVKKTIVVQKKK